MKKNDIVRLEITGLNSEGNGVGRYEGIVVFIPLSAVGDVLDVRILKVKNSYAYGRIEKIIYPSKDRIDLDCGVFSRCGGCVFRHISYKAELAAKQQFVEDAFTRIGNLSPEFLPIIANPELLYYRNKVQFPVGCGADGKMIYGMFAGRSHRIIPCTGCKLFPEIFTEIADHITAFCCKNNVPPYSEETCTGVLRHICIRKGYHSGEIHVTLAAAKNPGGVFSELGAELVRNFTKITGVTLNINNAKTNVILSEKPETLLAGKPVLNDTMSGKTVEISPKSFYQVNTLMAEKLYDIAASFADCTGKTLLDLYCGVGTIGLSMSDNAKEIIGVEIVESAVENAKRNALLNNAGTMRFICADAAKATEQLAAENIAPDVIILDPARKGCSTPTLDNILSFNAPKIVMISCNPSTAARDCAYLSSKGYQVEKVQPVDLFSRTGHVETVVILSHKKTDSVINVKVELGECFEAF